MIFTTLYLLGIPAVILYALFRKCKGAVADKEKYEQQQGSQATQSKEVEEVG